jgi:hypothetical protein
MTTFEIGLQDGRTLHIEATDQASALAGAQHFIANGTPTAPAAPVGAGNSAPPVPLNFDFNGARKAGYTDAEIAAHIGAQQGFDVSSAMKAGYSPTEIIAHLGGTPAESGVIDSARQGTADVLGGVGATLHDYLGQGLVGDALTRYSKAVAPKDFTPARIVGEDGSVHPGSIPAWLAQRAPGMVAQIAAARMMPGGVVPKIIAAAGTGTAMSAGNEANTAAANRTGDPNAEPNAADLTRGGATALAENAVGALPISRFIRGSGPMTATGAAGALQALKKLGVTAGAEGAGGASQSVVEQVGQSVGTPGGVKVDPTQVADAALGTGLTGGALAVPFGGGARDLLNARKYSALTPDLMPAARQFANRMQDAAGGRNLDAGVFTGSKAQATGADAFTKAQAGVHSELATAVADLNARVTLPPDASNILKSTAGGKMPTDADYNTLKAALGNDPQAPNILNLMQQAHAAQIVADTGHLGGGKFTGGLASAVGSKLTGETIGKTALVAAGAAFEGGAGHLIAYSPEIITALAASTALARLADTVTGARSPAGRFVSNFADGNSPVRVAPTIPPAPQAPAAPLNAPLGGPGQPWGASPPSVVPSVAQPGPSSQALQQLAKQSALPLRTLAAQSGPNAMARQALLALRALAAQSGPNAPTALPAGFASMLSNPGGSQNLLAPRAAFTAPVTDPVAALKELAARSTPVPTLPNVSNVTKTNGKVNVGNDADAYAIPYSPHSDKAPDVAARAFLQDAKAAGVKINNENGFITGVTRNITNIRSKATDVAARTPGVSSAALAAQFEGAATAKDAIAHRDWLIKTMPQAASLLSRYFSDAEITKIWKR